MLSQGTLWSSDDLELHYALVWLHSQLSDMADNISNMGEFTMEQALAEYALLLKSSVSDQATLDHEALASVGRGAAADPSLPAMEEAPQSAAAATANPPGAEPAAQPPHPTTFVAPGQDVQQALKEMQAMVASGCALLECDVGMTLSCMLAFSSDA